MKRKKKQHIDIYLTVLFSLLFIVWAITSIIEEIAYPLYCKKQEYKIATSYVNGTTDTNIYVLPVNIHLQINVNQSKDRKIKRYDLEYVCHGLILSSGHWKRIDTQVIEFKILQ